MAFKAQAEQIPRVFIYLDAEKAFDRIEWQYSKSVIKEFAIGNAFGSWMQLLYRDQSVIIVNERVCLEKIKLQYGVRQECPLSLLVFALALEPLAIAIRKETSIIVFRTHGFGSKIALYTADVCLLGNPISSIKVLHKVFEKLGSVSGYKINQSKSIMSGYNISNR